MRIAVSGAGGFVGRHVVAEFLARGLRPTLLRGPSAVADPLFAGLPAVEIDLARPDAPSSAIIGGHDALLHLAWEGLPRYQELRHFELELPRQYSFLKAVVTRGLPRLVVSGTCFEYGMQTGALAEGDRCEPDNPYGFAKDALRRQLQLLKRHTPFELVWARLFYLYGKGQAEGSLYTQLRRAAERGETSFDMSGGEQLRDYLPIEVAARHLVELTLSDRDVGVVNICSGRPIAVRDLVAGWIAAERWPIRPNLGRLPYPAHEPMAFWGDDRKLRETLGSDAVAR